MNFSDMHVAITGGAGFIGSHSVEALLAEGARVTVLDNFSSGHRDNLPKSSPMLSIVEGDIRSSADIARALAGTTHVLHLAAQVSVQASIEDPIASCGHNVVGFINVLDAARRHGVRRLVYASSAAVYGLPESLPLTEASAVVPISPYGLEKSIDERYADLYNRLYGFPSLGLRYFNVYGPRQNPGSTYSGVISKFAAALKSGGRIHVFGDGQQSRDFVFVTDVARVNLLALGSSFSGVCNVGTGTSVTLLELIATLELVCGRDAEPLFEPPSRGDIRDSKMSPERLLAWFGEYPSTPLAEGLSRMLRT